MFLGKHLKSVLVARIATFGLSKGQPVDPLVFWEGKKADSTEKQNLRFGSRQEGLRGGAEAHQREGAAGQRWELRLPIQHPKLPSPVCPSWVWVKIKPPGDCCPRCLGRNQQTGRNSMGNIKPPGIGPQGLGVPSVRPTASCCPMCLDRNQ